MAHPLTGRRAARRPPRPPGATEAWRAGQVDLRGSAFHFAGDEFVVLTFADRSPQVAERLTAAEQEVVLALLAGQSNAAIARARGRSARTVANQVARVFRKLGVSSRAELVARWTASALRKEDG